MAQRKSFAAVNWRIPTRPVTLSLRVVENKRLPQVSISVPPLLFLSTFLFRVRMLSFSSKSYREESKEETGVERNVLVPYEKRHFTDFIFAIAIVALWITMTAVGAVSIPDGNPYRLVSPVDDDVRAPMLFMIRIDYF